MRSLALAVNLTLSTLAAVTASGQSTPSNLVAAPAPSVRFPAEWYTSKSLNDAAPTTQAPITGAPYSATIVTSWSMPVSAGRPGAGMSQRGMRYRDGVGRTRTEESRGIVNLNINKPIEMPKEIEVNDVVTHCMFHWVEPWTSQGQAVATVSCFSSMYFDPWDTSWGVKSQTASESTQFNRTIKTQPLGYKILKGLSCLGARSTLMTSSAAKPGEPSLSDQVVLERWWSPQINEVIWFGPVPPQVGLPTFELTAIDSGEPDTALFYPPADYKIVNQGAR